MLRMALYKLEKISTDSELSDYQYSIQLDPEHAIFKGHFPGQPVLPGVCQIELLSNSLEQEIGKQVYLENAKNIKFLKIIDPLISKHLQLKVSILESSLENIRISAVIDASEGVYFKFKGTFKFTD